MGTLTTGIAIPHVLLRPLQIASPACQAAQPNQIASPSYLFTKARVACDLLDMKERPSALIARHAANSTFPGNATICFTSP